MIEDLALSSGFNLRQCTLFVKILSSFIYKWIKAKKHWMNDKKLADINDLTAYSYSSLLKYLNKKIKALTLVFYL